MNSTVRVHVTQSLNVTQADYIHDLSKMAKTALEDLYSRWYFLGASVIDVIIRVGFLAFFTALVVTIAYSHLYQRAGMTGRDHVGLMIPSIIALWWANATTYAVSALSDALQRYLRLGSNMVPIADEMDTVSECAVQASDCTYAFSYYKPVYTYAMHQCVGTAALATQDVVIEAMICVFVWGTLLTNRKFAKGCILALFVATFVSATVHTKNACWPAPVPAESRIPPWNVVEEGLAMDNTTSSLFRTTVVVAIFLFIQRAWETRHNVKAAHVESLEVGQASAAEARTIRRRFILYGLALGAVLALVREAYRDPVNLVEYAFQSWIKGFFLPMLGTCPALIYLANRDGRPVNESVSKEGGLLGGDTPC